MMIIAPALTMHMFLMWFAILFANGTINHSQFTTEELFAPHVDP